MLTEGEFIIIEELDFKEKEILAITFQSAGFGVYENLRYHKRLKSGNYKDFEYVGYVPSVGMIGVVDLSSYKSTRRVMYKQVMEELTNIIKYGKT